MLSDLQACKDRAGFAALLGISPKELAYTLFKIPEAEKYASFCISKKNGGSRHILAPCDRLKWAQRKLLELLYECEDDVADTAGKEPNLRYGFRRKVGIIENAHIHKKRCFVLNLDIKDFFDQFNFGRVRGFFIKDSNFGLDPLVATTIAQIACFQDKLPQGSPCSPHIANLITHFFDIRMARFLRPRRCAYSRYADDITISTNLEEFPESVAVPATAPQGWELANDIADIFSRAGLEINQSKVRMSERSSRQMVTGLTVNVRPNVTRDFYLQTRAMCHSLTKTGAFVAKPFCDTFGENCGIEPAQQKPKSPMNVLEGRLSHILQVRERYDLRDIKEKRREQSQIWKTSRQFYQYKYFVAGALPLIISEGPSDVIYIRLAAQQLKLKLPQLYNGSGKDERFALQFLKSTGNPAMLLGLTGGAGNIEKFLHQYHTEIKHFNQAGRTNPIIIVVDNDSGGSGVFSKIKKLYGVSIDVSDPKQLHKIAKDLYLVKTAHVGTNHSTCIEDSLPNSVKAVILNGKTFSPAANADTAKHYGKMPLAHYVKDNASSIDFSKFETLLRAIDAAVVDAKP